VTPAPPAVTFVAVPEIQEILNIVKDLQARVGSLEQARVPPALPAPPASPAPPAAEWKEIQQWTVRLSKALIAHLKAVAYERRIPPQPTCGGTRLESADGSSPLDALTGLDSGQECLVDTIQA
jgi:hypothetical protein